MNQSVFKRLLLVCAVLFALVVAVVALVVVPAVESDVSPNASPGRAVPAFWVNVGLNLLLAVVCVAVAVWTKIRRPSSTAILVVVAIVALLLGLALIDAAFAFRSHDSIMRNTPALLFVCAAADMVAGAFVVLAVLRRSRME